MQKYIHGYARRASRTFYYLMNKNQPRKEKKPHVDEISDRLLSEKKEEISSTSHLSILNFAFKSSSALKIKIEKYKILYLKRYIFNFVLMLF